jgi:hypothetical protein
LAATVACTSSGVSSGRSLPPKKLRAVPSPTASVADPISSTYHGSGVRYDTSTPSPRLPSPPNTRPIANG